MPWLRGQCVPGATIELLIPEVKGPWGLGACSTPVTDGRTVAANAADAEAGENGTGEGNGSAPPPTVMHDMFM